VQVILLSHSMIRRGPCGSVLSWTLHALVFQSLVLMIRENHGLHNLCGLWVRVESFPPARNLYLRGGLCRLAQVFFSDSSTTAANSSHPSALCHNYSSQLHRRRHLLKTHKSLLPAHAAYASGPSPCRTLSVGFIQSYGLNGLIHWFSSAPWLPSIGFCFSSLKIEKFIFLYLTVFTPC
jgi:hypothetical protein